MKSDEAEENTDGGREMVREIGMRDKAEKKATLADT